MLQKLYDRTLELSDHPKAIWILALLSFAESSFFPIPPDVLLLPMVLTAPTKAFRIAFVCSAASVLGGIFGYIIGAYFFDVVGQPIVDFYSLQHQFEQFKVLYNDHGAIIVAVAGFSPIPYKVFTIASGVTGLDISTFITASALSRSARFFLVAALLWKFGEPIRGFVEKHLAKLTLLFCVLLVGSFIILKYL
ncbi:YqaA family protein [Pseudemcibacter aquimaris]|uniref:YqaA family protein n=1 Tax=Pseudemcibacter aquimaris TaxID=2857064 RepID=UPI002010D9EF|nr:YqaA family protein [Pseudemcibacter aquimaris]MCC3862089.1 DedA family protein [Pseudemcibacter aquimaris]WDU58842.1 DedA family protein [Pseudemcibacter aquimaris]